MSSANNHDKTTGVGQRKWLRRNLVSLLTVFFVTVIMVGLFLYSDFYPEKVEEFENYGYLGAFLVSLATNATIILPFPGLVVIIALGATFNPVFVALAGGVGAAIGEMTGYLLGYSGRGVAKNRMMYRRAAEWLDKWGALAVYIFAITPLPFDVLGIVAGLLRFPLWKFFIACWLGKTVLYIGMTFAGSWGWEAFIGGGLGLKSPLLIFVLAIVVALVLMALSLVIRRRLGKRGQ